jgi:hypothetical protein
MLLTIINYIAQNLLLPVISFQIPYFGVDELDALLDPLSGYLITAFSGLGFLFPILLILALILVVALAEFGLFGFRIIKYIINVVRGSGA